MRSTVLSFLLLLAGVAYIAAVDHHVVEVLLVVEPSVVRKYEKFGYSNEQAVKEINEDLKFFIYEVNKFFGSMDTNLAVIEVRPSQVIFEAVEMVKDCQLMNNNTQLFDQMGLELFKKWLAANQHNITKPYDLAIAYTGYDLIDANPHILGVATHGGACNHANHANVAVVEFTGLQSTAFTTAHEIAHSLGSHHDPRACRGGFLMEERISYDNAHKWSFSPCTKRSIQKFIIDLDLKGNNCLLETTAEAPEFNLGSQSHRDVMNPEKLCQRKLETSEAYLCHSQDLYKKIGGQFDGICQSMFCAPKKSRFCVSTDATEGMVCGNGKRCSRNKCVAAPVDFPTPQDINDECVFKDEKSGDNFGFKSCEAFIKNNGSHFCYQSSVYRPCCSTCDSHRTNITDCEYGDKGTSCHKENICSTANNRKVCCQTCANYKPPAKGECHGDGSTQCAVILASHGMAGLCTTDNNRKVCCKSCKDYKPPGEGCHKDRNAQCPGMLQTYGINGLCKTENNRKVCCKSCAGYKPPTESEGCPHKDRNDKCPGMLKDYGLNGLCHSENNRKVCCKSCAGYKPTTSRRRRRRRRSSGDSPKEDQAVIVVEEVLEDSVEVDEPVEVIVDSNQNGGEDLNTEA